MIDRLIIKYGEKVYSIPISHYICEDAEYVNDQQRIKLWINSDMIVINTLFVHLLNCGYFKSNKIIFPKVFGRTFKLSGISREYNKNLLENYVYIITLDKAEVPTPQNFLSL